MTDETLKFSDSQPDDRMGSEAVERALTLLDALGSASAPLSLKELALKTGLSKATILRLTVSLERFGYVGRSLAGAYQLGPTLWRLGSVFRQNLELEPIIRPAMQALVSLTQESASFWIPRGDERMCLFRQNSPRSARSHVEEGESSPIGKGSGGHVVAYYLGLPTRFSEDIQAHGVVATLGDRDPDVASVSAPVLGPNREFVGALTLAGILNRFEAHVPEYKVIVKQAAASITRQLGGEPDGAPPRRAEDRDE
jgi:DNA-binding IclR family transcriptional regulator